MDENPETISSVVLMNDESVIQEQGPYGFERDGGYWEVALPIETSDDQPSDSLRAKAITKANPPYESALAMLDSVVLDYGQVVGTNILEDEELITIRVDSVNYMDAEEIEFGDNES